MADLVTPEDLADFPGAPFAEPVVRSASESVRAEAGWHIAPEVSETLVIDSPGGRVLMLPTLRVVEVAEVRDLTGGAPRVVGGWRLSQAGMLSLAGGWPAGFGAIEVDLTHGYESCPADLLGIVAERSLRTAKDSTVVQESLGSRSVSYRDAPLASSVLSRYRIPSLP